MNGRPANVKRLSCAAKALLAHAFEIGAKRADRLSRAMAVKLAKSNAGNAATVARTSAAEREALCRGELSLSQLHNKEQPRQLSDSEAEHLIVDERRTPLTRLRKPPPETTARRRVK
jgi:hypothetical protein